MSVAQLMFAETSSLRACHRGIRSLVFGCTLVCVGWSSAHAASILEGDDQVVASRGGATVTLAEIDAKVMELPPELRAGYLDDPSRIEETVGGMLLSKQLAAKAYEFGVDDNPYFKLQLEQAEERYLATRARLLNEQQIQMPDFSELAQEAYLANPAKYASPETLELTHILVSDKGRDADAAKARAEEAHELAVAGTRDFASLVEEYSDETSRAGKTDGRLQKVTRGAMVPEFEEAAFALKNPGDISHVVKTEYGYHVIQLNGRATSQVMSFEELKPRIMEELRRSYVSSQKSNLPDTLRSMKIEASQELVASLRSRYTADGPKGKRLAGGGTTTAPAAATAD